MSTKFNLPISGASYNAAEMQVGAAPASLALIAAVPDPNIKLLLHGETRRLRILTGLDYTYQPFIDSLGQVWTGRNNTGGDMDVRDKHGNLLKTVATSGNNVTGIAEDSNGFIWAPHFVNDTIDIIDPFTNTIVYTITINKLDNNPGYTGDYAGPYACQFANGAMYVAIQCPGHWGNGYIRKYNITTYAKITDILLPVDSAPHFMCSDATHLFVANEVSHTVTKILLADDSVVVSIPCFNGWLVKPVKDTVNNRIWVTGYGNGEVSVIDNVTNAVIYTITGVTNAIGIDFDGTYMWVSSASTVGQVRKYSLAYALVETVHIDCATIRGLAYHAAGACIFLCCYNTAGEVHRIATAVPSAVEEDSAQTPHTITVTGKHIFTSDAAFGATAKKLDGATRGVVVMTEKLGVSDFTLNANVKPLRLGAAINERILAWYQDDSNRGYFYFNQAAFGLVFVQAGVARILVEWLYTFVQNTRYEIEIGRQGSNFYGFGNGVKIGATLVDADAVPTYTNDNVYLDVDYYSGFPNQYSNYIRDEIMIKIGACDHTDSYTPKTAAIAQPYNSAIGSGVTFAEQDSGSAGTAWDMSTIPYVESIKDNHYGKVLYQYSAHNAAGVPAWNGVWLTWLQLRAAANPTSRRFQLRTQHSSYTALDSASIGDLAVYGVVASGLVAGARSQIGGKSEVFGG